MIRARALLAALLSTACFGCNDDAVLYVNGSSSGNVPIGAATDDGTVRVYRTQPASANGFVFGDSQDLVVGNVSDGADVLSNRALLRFNLSQWSGGDLSLRILCTARVGSPTYMQVYAVSDFGGLPAASDQPSDVSAYWYLAESGVYVGNLYGTSNGWLQLQIKESIIQSNKASNGILALMLTYDTKRPPGEYYSFASFEKAKALGYDPPYLEQYIYPQE